MGILTSHLLSAVFPREQFVQIRVVVCEYVIDSSSEYPAFGESSDGVMEVILAGEP